MPTRVVVTGVDASGTSRVRRDGPVAAEVVLGTLDGMRFAVPWELPLPAGPGDGDEPVSAVGTFVPPAGSLRFVAVEVPPAREDVVPDPAAVVAEVGAQLPGLLEAAVPDAGPGMHRTRTVDLLTVVRGRVLLLLDDGTETELGPGDCVVQQGSLHAWRACSDEPCLLAGVMVSTG